MIHTFSVTAYILVHKVSRNLVLKPSERGTLRPPSVTYMTVIHNDKRDQKRGIKIRLRSLDLL